MTIVVPESASPSRTRVALCVAAVIACIPYAVLKIAWIAGSDLGTEDAEAAELMHETSTVIANVMTLGLELGAVAIVAGLTFVRRIPPFLLVGPIWVGTGLLAPVAVGLPIGLVAQGIAGGAPAPDDGGLHGWVFALVYGGFIIQTPLLVGAFALHVTHRWPWVFRLRGRDITPGSTYALQLLMARTALVVTALLAVVSILWAIDAEAFAGPSGFETVAQRTFVLTGGVLPLAGALGAHALVRRRREGPLLRPLAATWVGSATAFATVALPSAGQTGFESFVSAVSGMTGVALAITGLLVLIDAQRR
ncbi:hypothetical protein [Solicola gregarius]|uniref:LigA protein n=1 Tax=Solicola gregarius TaxID=2908642 RepID=A0AA46YLC8_9ACTN|nr:hypothetical protein [Solicola gregarius]UYM06477.1 hypothetical protein L0C25_05225 [Solicola gregarius]